MRASSSWIKLQFVVRKHVMNTYQMHTLSLFLFYHIFSTSLTPSSLSLIFCLFDSTPISVVHLFSVFLMVCHIDVTYSAVLYNVPLCMYMCMHMCVFRFLLRYIWDLYSIWAAGVLLPLLPFIITSLSQATCICYRHIVHLFLCI